MLARRTAEPTIKMHKKLPNLSKKEKKET